MTKIKSNEALYLDMYDAILINKTLKADEETWLRFMGLMTEVEGLEEARSCNDSSYSRNVISAKTHEAAAEMLHEAERCTPAMKDGAENDTGRETLLSGMQKEIRSRTNGRFDHPR